MFYSPFHDHAAPIVIPYTACEKIFQHNTEQLNRVATTVLDCIQRQFIEIAAPKLGMLYNGPLTRCVKLRIAHAPQMPGTFSPSPRVSKPDMHHGTCVTHVPWCMPGSLTSGFLWSQWRGKHSRRMRYPQFCVSGKRPMQWNQKQYPQRSRTQPLPMAIYDSPNPWNTCSNTR